MRNKVDSDELSTSDGSAAAWHCQSWIDRFGLLVLVATAPLVLHSHGRSKCFALPLAAGQSNADSIPFDAQRVWSLCCICRGSGRGSVAGRTESLGRKF